MLVISLASRVERRPLRDQRSPAMDPAETAFFSDLQRILWRKERPLPKPLVRVCGVDAAYDGDRVFASACLLERGELVASALCEGTCSLPYSSGLFYLREGPFAVAAVRSLGVRPQLVCFDAHGAAHPRSAGLATVCGMVAGIPSVGVAKSLLVGDVVQAVGLERIVYEGRAVGFATGEGRARRYWSPGYSVSLARLRSVVREVGSECLRALAQADAAAGRARSMSRTASRR